MGCRVPTPPALAAPFLDLLPDLPPCSIGDRPIPHPRNARIVYMETRPLAEVRQDLSRIVDAAVRSHERFDITRNGKRAAVLISAEDYDSLIETLDILADADLVREVRAGLQEAEAGDVSSHDEVVAEVRKAGKPRAGS
jgi:antitoxin YefM